MSWSRSQRAPTLRSRGRRRADACRRRPFPYSDSLRTPSLITLLGTSVRGCRLIVSDSTYIVILLTVASPTLGLCVCDSTLSFMYLSCERMPTSLAESTPVIQRILSLFRSLTLTHDLITRALSSPARCTLASTSHRSSRRSSHSALHALHSASLRRCPLQFDSAQAVRSRIGATSTFRFRQLLFFTAVPPSISTFVDISSHVPLYFPCRPTNPCSRSLKNSGTTRALATPPLRLLPRQ